MSDEARSTNLVIPVEKVPVAAFQAIYHHLTKKTETLNKFYKGTYRLTANDLEDLYRQVEQTVGQYQIKGNQCEISLSLANGEVHTYSSYEKFAMTNTGAFVPQTISVGFSYDFMIVLPEDENRVEAMSLRHKLRMSFRTREDLGELVAENVVFSGRTIRSLSRSAPHLATHIEYSDYTIARTLQALLNEWADRIKFSDENVITESTAKLIMRTGFYTIFLLVGSAFLGSVFFEPPIYEDVITPMRYLVMVIAVAIGALGLGIYFHDKIDSFVSLLRPKSTILLTHGDNEAREFIVNRRAKARGYLALIFSGIVLATAVSVFANYLTSMVVNDDSGVSADRGSG